MMWSGSLKLRTPNDTATSASECWGDQPFPNHHPPPRPSQPLCQGPIVPRGIKAWPAELQPQMFLNSLPRSVAVPKSLRAVSSDTCVPRRPADTAPAQRPWARSCTSAPRPAAAPAPAPAEHLPGKEGKAQSDPNAYREGGGCAQAQLLHGEWVGTGPGQTTPTSPGLVAPLSSSGTGPSHLSPKLSTSPTPHQAVPRLAGGPSFIHPSSQSRLLIHHTLRPIFSFIRSRIHSLRHSLTHLLIFSFTFSFSRSFPHGPPHPPFTDPSFPGHTPRLTHPSPHSHILPPTHPSGPPVHPSIICFPPAALTHLPRHYPPMGLTYASPAGASALLTCAVGFRHRAGGPC